MNQDYYRILHTGELYYLNDRTSPNTMYYRRLTRFGIKTEITSLRNNHQLAVL